MSKLAYPAIFTPDTEDGGFVITFPDLPEAITQADSIEQGLEEATAIKVLLAQTLIESAVSKVELARRIRCDEKEVRRLLDPKHASKLPKLEAAFKALGCKLIIEKTPSDSFIQQKAIIVDCSPRNY